MYKGYITDVTGIEVGHAQNYEAGTGCTVIMSPTGATAGVDVRGAAPGTRETDLICPGNLVDKINGVLLSGGSAFGLAAADGVMRYMEERGIGFDVGVTRVPIVAGAVLYDLDYRDFTIRPDSEMGYQACMNAKDGEILQGSVGAGTGATVGKVLGVKNSMKGGIGTCSIKLPGDVTVGAIIAVNAFGNVVDPSTGRILAGARDPETGELVSASARLLSDECPESFPGTNTTIGVVATDASLNREQANRVACMAHDGLALTIRPVHTMVDGDTLFVLSTGAKNADANIVGMAAAEVVSRAVINAVLHSQKE